MVLKPPKRQNDELIKSIKLKKVVISSPNNKKMFSNFFLNYVYFEGFLIKYDK